MRELCYTHPRYCHTLTTYKHNPRKHAGVQCLLTCCDENWQFSDASTIAKRYNYLCIYFLIFLFLVVCRFKNVYITNVLIFFKNV